MQFIADNLQWTQQQVQLLAPSDSYWAQVGLNLAMLRGIVAGYNQVPLPLPTPTKRLLQVLVAITHLISFTTDRAFRP